MEFIINPAMQETIDDFVKSLELMIEDGQCLKVKVKKTERKSVEQLGLVHVWFRVYASEAWGVSMSSLSEDEQRRIKTSFKRQCYAQTHYDFILQPTTDVLTGEKGRELRSIESYDMGELYLFMDWMQMYAANNGVTLEARGEHARLKAKSLGE